MRLGRGLLRIGPGLGLCLLLSVSPLAAASAPPPSVQSSPAPPSSGQPSPALRERAADLIGLLNGRPGQERLFAPAFLSQIPLARVQAIARQLVRDHGRAVAVDRIDLSTPNRATVFVKLQRATIRTEIDVEPAAPHRVTGLLFAAVEVRGDNFATVAREIAALGGRTSLAVARLDANDGLNAGDGPAMLFAHDGDRPLAVASAFKLFLLAELSRAVKAGERRWSDVVPLGGPSVPGSVMQSWPAQAPLTLHGLAALMISRSDNRATDTLLALLGRERVEALLPALGITAPERMRPLLSTREAAVIKAGPDQALAAQWTQATEVQRRALLAGPVAGVPAEKVALDRLMGSPTAIDAVEWIATTADLVRVADWLRRNADPDALAILAINGGIPPHLAGDFAYIGYKGGSEAGVLNMTFLVGAKDGAWYAVSGTWNDPSRTLDEIRFEMLMRRAIALLRVKPARARPLSAE